MKSNYTNKVTELRNKSYSSVTSNKAYKRQVAKRLKISMGIPFKVSKQYLHSDEAFIKYLSSLGISC